MNGMLKNGINGVKVGFKSIDFVLHNINLGKEWFLIRVAKKMPRRITPNSLSWLRIGFAGLIILALISFRYVGPLVIWLFLASVVTDLIDGPIARVRSCASQKGAFLDRIGDKLLVCSLIIATLWSRDKFLATAIVVSEAISLSIGIAAIRRHVPADSNWLGKWKMGAQSAGIIVLLFLPQKIEIAVPILWIALGFGIASLGTHFIEYSYPRIKKGS